jgi:hypothetical protein
METIDDLESNTKNFANTTEPTSANNSNLTPTTEIQPTQEEDTNKRQLTTTQIEELGKVELSALECAKNFTELSTRLRENLKIVTDNSGKHMEIYKLSVDNLQEQVNESLVSMHTLITKCQELNQDFKKIHEMHAEIRSIRKDVDTLYALLNQS